MGLLSTIGAASARSFGLTRLSAAIKDAYFNLTTLLLPGNGTNGAQNNTFLDSSSNNFTITRNGNTTQGTFTPFSQTGWGNYFATGSLQAGSNAALAPGSGNFTIECWVYPVGNTSYMGIYQNYTDGLSRSTALRISINTTDNTSLIVQTQASAIITTATGAMTANAWNHIALVRNGSGSNNLVLYVNGVSKGTATNTTNFSDGYAQIGNTVYNAVNYYWNGYISNFRLTTGAALYTGSFTPSTVPLTTSVSSGTVALLTCQSNRFIDNSSNNFSFTISGTPSVQAFEPFAPGAAYSTTTVGGSGYFDGTGDYLATPSNAAFSFGTGDFTFECWVYATSTPSDVGIYEGRSNGTTTTADGFTLGAFSGSVIRIFSNGALISSSGTSYVNAWCHVAVTRISGTFNLYINGVSQGTSATSRNFTNTDAIIGGGRYSTTSSVTTYFPGYICGVRMVKGQALTTGNFTPPTSPVTTSSVGWTGANVASSITGTVSLLLNYTNAGITDATAKNDFETVGNAQISTAQSKFGGSSMSFNGTSDYLTIAATQNLNIGTGDFTLEAWIYPSSFSSTRALFSFGNNNVFYFNTSGIPYYGIFGVSDTAFGSTAVSTNTWTYVAFVRSGSTITCYINGSSTGTITGATATTAIGNGTALNYVGFHRGGNYFSGYIDDLRITKGYARTISTPTVAFPLQ